MITEDYVSFEISKLLKEKGFNEPCQARYGSNGSFYYERYPIEVSGCEMYNNLLAPTLQMTMKWLRETHNLHIEVFRTACGYLYTIVKISTGSDIYDDSYKYDGDDENSGQWTTYEKACESAIVYCLKYLI